jgi:hypothetical protein
MESFESTSLPKSPVVEKKFFTLAEANRSLTLVRRVVSDIVRDYRELRKLHDQCRSLEAKGDTQASRRVRQQYASVNDHLAELNEELEKIGCEIKDYHLGLVDFPAFSQEREVYLCWALREEQIEYWHEVHAGYAGRRPITDLPDCL